MAFGEALRPGTKPEFGGIDESLSFSILLMCRVCVLRRYVQKRITTQFLKFLTIIKAPPNLHCLSCFYVETTSSLTLRLSFLILSLPFASAVLSQQFLITSPIVT